ncbi:hypothetical protein F3Y22_tig00110123pilonHSYRG00090 [Hibiscus syriacus]|uniref:RNase H type-1 domain-containing protein n=1 Tax=Hibiscus syriacus TaxID=106335 RepID=A0A6A3BMR5_HIBSY|nr:hypothetical protein F3Y22_tig00110123pilonHSYRG00090 [Hibiscus syriacus]
MDITRDDSLLAEELYIRADLEERSFSSNFQRGCQHVKCDVTDDEVKKAMFDMNPIKSPHKVGLNTLFYQSQWHTVSLLYAISRVTKDIFQFIIDKVRNKFNNWEATKFSMAGRVTLSKATMWAIPNNFMQKVTIAKGVCNQIEKIARRFIWGDSNGFHKPTLGASVLRSKYRIQGSIPNTINAKNGNGRSTLFRKDVWIPEHDPLMGYNAIAPSFTGHETVRDFSTDDGQWNHQLLKQAVDDAMYKWIMTNSERARRGLVCSPLCPDCASAEKTILHILRDCQVASSGWVHVNFYWRHIFGILIWSLDGAKAIKVGNIGCTRKLKPRIQKQRWHAPSANCVKLNTDGSVQQASMEATSGGVIRNSAGCWVEGCHRYIGQCPIYQVELWAIFDGLNVAWDLGYHNIIVETDNSMAVRQINSPDHCHENALIKQIQILLSKQWSPRVYFICNVPQAMSIVCSKLTMLV